MVAPPRSEAYLLAAAAMLEDLLGTVLELPVDPRNPQADEGNGCPSAIS